MSCCIDLEDFNCRVDPSAVLDFLWACLHNPSLWQGRVKKEAVINSYISMVKSVCLSVCLSVCPSVCLCLSTCLSTLCVSAIAGYWWREPVDFNPFPTGVSGGLHSKGSSCCVCGNGVNWLQWLREGDWSVSEALTSIFLLPPPLPLLFFPLPPPSISSSLTLLLTAHLRPRRYSIPVCHCWHAVSMATNQPSKLSSSIFKHTAGTIFALIKFSEFYTTVYVTIFCGKNISPKHKKARCTKLSFVCYIHTHRILTCKNKCRLIREIYSPPQKFQHNTVEPLLKDTPEIWTPG